MCCRIWQTLLFFCFCLLASMAVAKGGGPRELWCVAKNNAEDSALQSSLDWACGPGGADCGPIQKDGRCYDASDLQRTASYAFNDYYLKHGSSEDSCSFSNTAALTSLDPSHNNCKFPSSLNAGSNGNFSGSAMPRSDNGKLTSSNSIATIRMLDLRSIIFHIFFVITLLIL